MTMITEHIHRFKTGGSCETEGCKVWCPHVRFENIGDTEVCVDCGCLRPLPGSPDFYEVPLDPGRIQYCTLEQDPVIDVEPIDVASQPWQKMIRALDQTIAGGLDGDLK